MASFHSDPGYTRIIHGGLEPDPATGAILTPVHQTTTYRQRAVGDHKGYTYTRSGNPTVAALERNLGEIEGCPPAACFTTGMAAISALLLSVLGAGDEVIVSDVVYGGTVRLLRQVLDRFGVKPRFVDTSRPEAVGAAITPQTRLVLVETPANPTLKLTDLAAVARVAHDAGALLAVDNTFLTAVLQRPFDLGADVVVYSTTKYIEGHNSTVGGALLSRDEALLERVRLVQGTVGFPQSPWEAWLTLRGLKTLPIRMERHSKNALRVARWLEQHPQVERVVYPGLDSFPQQDLATRQQRSGGGMLTFEVRGGAAVGREAMRSVRLCSLAENLGAVETLITHPATMTHASLTEDERDALGIGAGLIRLSVGLEDAEDIIADLAQAIDCAVAIAQASGTKTSRVELDEDASLYFSPKNDADSRVVVPVPRRGGR
jgi:cystathionine beta-lyase/cystathionine gamma-synthase